MFTIPYFCSNIIINIANELFFNFINIKKRILFPKMSFYCKNNQLLIPSIIFLFFVFFLIEYFTPINSDDFFFARLGLGFEPHYNLYMNWSGRLLADYASSALLQINNHFIVSVIIASCATAIFFFISVIPNIIFQSTSNNIYWKLLCIASLYWISNPNLGQTTFWIVGACNYLVTSFFITFFLYFFYLHIIQIKKTKKIMLFAAFVIAVIAGCTNENMGGGIL